MIISLEHLIPMLEDGHLPNKFKCPVCGKSHRNLMNVTFADVEIHHVPICSGDCLSSLDIDCSIKIPIGADKEKDGFFRYRLNRYSDQVGKKRQKRAFIIDPKTGNDYNIVDVSIINSDSFGNLVSFLNLFFKNLDLDLNKLLSKS